MRNHTPEALRNAKRLRGGMSLPEVLLWRRLRLRTQDVNSRCQHPIGRFVVDCSGVERKLVVEIDGKSHAMRGKPEQDGRRDEWLRSRGFQVVRLSAEDVLFDVAVAAERLVMLCMDHPPPSAMRAATSPGGRGF